MICCDSPPVRTWQGDYGDDGWGLCRLQRPTHSNQRAFDQVSDDTLAALQLPRDPTELLESGVPYCRFKDKDKVIERFQTMKAGF